MISDPQVSRLYAIGRAHGWTREGIHRLFETNYHKKSSLDLSPQQYDEVCKFLETSPVADVATMKRDDQTLDLFEQKGNTP
jgi:hypothetical protein